MAKKRPKTWDDEFNRHLDKGMDHADAAYRADEWARRSPKATTPEVPENE